MPDLCGGIFLHWGISPYSWAFLSSFFFFSFVKLLVCFTSSSRLIKEMSWRSPVSEMQGYMHTQVHTRTCYREQNRLSQGDVCSLGFAAKAWACPRLACLVLMHHRLRTDGSRSEQSRFGVNSADDGKQMWDARGRRGL